MKTATFEYTSETEVDSSLAQAVYYNSGNQTMAVEFWNGGTAIYDEVPEAVYRGFVNTNSIGITYNKHIKPMFKNISEGTVYNVNFVLVGQTAAPAVDNTTEFTYRVKGYVRHVGDFQAGSLEEARQKFLDSLHDEGYDGEDLAVQEVYILG